MNPLALLLAGVGLLLSGGLGTLLLAPRRALANTLSLLRAGGLSRNSSSRFPGTRGTSC